MNSDEVFAAIEEVADAKGKQKEEVIKQYAGDEEFKRTLVAALDPLTTYGMAKVPPIEGGVEGVPFDDVVWDTLDKMAKRELTGNAAIERVSTHLRSITPQSAELLRRIITKDLRAGFRVSTVNKAIPKLIPTFACMLAHKFEDKRAKKWPMMVEPKLDGVRVLAVVISKEKSVRFFSRSGKEFTTFDHLKDALMQAVSGITDRTMIFDGEMLSGNFNKTVGDVRRKSKQAVDAEFHVFAALFYDEFISGKTDLEHKQLRYTLEAYFEDHFDGTNQIKLVPSYNVNSIAEIDHIYRAVQESGGEGVIVKDPEKPYVCKRNHAWMKIKAEESVDVNVIGAFEGTGKYVGALGGLVVDLDGVEVSVGGGFSDAQRDQFWEAYQRDLESTADVEMTHELLGRMIEVEYHEITPDGSLRHPRFKRFRDSLTGEKE